MAITTDSNGNTFAGNFIVGDAWEPNDLLAVLRAGLGSDDRANINRTDISNFRIDFRLNENTTDETLTGVINSPALPQIAVSSGQTPSGSYYTLTTNSRMAFAQKGNGIPTAVVYANYLLESGSSNVPVFGSIGSTAPNFTSGSTFNAVVRDASISYFIIQGSTYYFHSSGVLENSLLSFPANRYALSIRGDGATQIKATYQPAGDEPLFASTAIANFAHNNGAATTDEVELYLRRQSDNQQLGFIPNIIKVTDDGGLTTPTVGEIVTLDFSGTTGFYSTYGSNRKGIIVGRLGNTSETDLTGDFLAMLVAS